MSNAVTSHIGRGKLIFAPTIFFLLTVSALPVFAQEEKLFKEFIVYRDKSGPNHFVPSGYMPDGQCIKQMDNWQENCQQGKTCIKVAYDIACSTKGNGWAGVYWLNPADNWGDRKGGFNLTGAKKLVFWARGDKGGETIAEFKIGGVGISRDFPDSDTVGIGPVILSKTWKEYSIDLRGRDLSYVSGGFAWVANVENNPESCTFYIDNIYYE